MTFKFITNLFNKSSDSPTAKALREAKRAFKKKEKEKEAAKKSKEAKDAALKHLNDGLSELVQKLPKMIAKEINRMKTDGESYPKTNFHPEDALTFSEIRSSEGYRALHAFCSKPEVNVQVQIQDYNSVNHLSGFFTNPWHRNVTVDISKPYKRSDDIKLMRKLPKPTGTTAAPEKITEKTATAEKTQETFEQLQQRSAELDKKIDALIKAQKPAPGADAIKPPTP